MAGRKVSNPIVAKRGRQRLVVKRPARSKSKERKSVKYVRQMLIGAGLAKANSLPVHGEIVRQANSVQIAQGKVVRSDEVFSR